MSTAFDPSKTQQQQPAQRQANSEAARVYDERVMVSVDRYVREGADGPVWAVGHRLSRPDEKVAVRLSTVEERVSDNPDRYTADKIRKQYEGENRRHTLTEKNKDKIKLIAFDGVRALGPGEDGVARYRAHWPQTMATSPNAEVTIGLGTITLYTPPEDKPGKSTAHVEFLRTATLVDGHNVRAALEAALKPEDAEGRPRDAHAVMRIFHQGREVGTARIHPEREQASVPGDFGDEITIMRAVEGGRSVDSLMGGRMSGIDNLDANNDLARAVVAGLEDADEPPVANLGDKDTPANFFHGAKSGELTVEIIGVERMNFGADTAKTYLKDRDRPQYAAFLVADKETGYRQRGYAEVAVAFQRFEDGRPYAVYANSVENWPKMRVLEDFNDKMPLSKFLPEEEAAVNARREKLEGSELGM